MVNKIKPGWIDEHEYPFTNHYYKTNQGDMHYIDEGTGDPIVLLHGNPGWSFEFREIIKEMMNTNRCIAPDFLGFGLSDKPADWDYLPIHHAEMVEKLLDHLNLKDITFVITDWGGPVAISYATKHPEKVKKLLVCNTWFWPVKGNKNFEIFSGLIGGSFGKFLVFNFNIIGRMLSKVAYGPRNKIPELVLKHFYMPHAEKIDRIGTWVFPREIIGSTDWLESLWEQRDLIKHIPTAILWGDSDIAFKESELKVWTDLMENHSLKVLQKIGHFPPEEAPEEIINELKAH
jgi:haloalkane dehalogenase